MASAGQPGPDVRRELREAVGRSEWSEVVRLTGGSLCTEQHCWALEETLSRAPLSFVEVHIDDILDDCARDRVRIMVPHLMARGLWDCVAHVLQRNIDCVLQSWAIQQAVKCVSDLFFIDLILPHCSKYDLELAVVHLTGRGLWKSIGKVLEIGVSTAKHRWAVEEASKQADQETFVRFILPACGEEELEHVTHHLVTRGLWMSVGRTLERGVPTALHTWAVTQAAQRASNDEFLLCVLSHCLKEHLDPVLGRLVSRSMWRSVDGVLERGVSTAQRRWALEQALAQTEEQVFALLLLHHCTDEELTQMVAPGWQDLAEHLTDEDFSVTQHILTYLVGQDLWGPVGRFLQRGISRAQCSWAVQQASKRAGESQFVRFILPHCRDEELDQVAVYLAVRAQWRPVSEVLERGVSAKVRRWIIKRAMVNTSEQDLAENILPHCASQELGHLLQHMVSWGLWEPVDSATPTDDTIALHIFSQLISRCLWQAVAKFLRRHISEEHHKAAAIEALNHVATPHFVHYVLPHCCDEELGVAARHLVLRGLWEPVERVLAQSAAFPRRSWVVEQAAEHADGGDFVRYVLPHCRGEELDQAVVHLMSRGLWTAVDKVLERGVSAARRRWAVGQALKWTALDMYANYMLHHCTEDELEEVFLHMVSIQNWRIAGRVRYDHLSVTRYILSQLLTQKLWEAVGRFLQQRSVSRAHHGWAVQQASRCATGEEFVSYILPQCHGEELDHVTRHLMARGLWRSVGKVLERGVSTAQHRWVVTKAAQHADDDSFDLYIVRRCGKDDVVATLPHLVANSKWRSAKRVLYGSARDALHAWVSSGQSGEGQDAVFWNLVHNCHIEASLGHHLHRIAAQVIPAVHDGYHRYSLCSDVSFLASLVSWEKGLCKVLLTSLLHTLCDVVCSADRESIVSPELSRQSVSDIYTHITACIEDNKGSVQGSTLKVIRNKKKWTAVFTETADRHRTDSLFILDFLQGLNLYHTSRRGETDDAVFLTMLAVFPLFPQLQSVALRLMIDDKRWDVLGQACLSHVWEHDRRQLFKTAVEQRQWGVVRGWADHTVQDDQREWAMKEAFRESQWEAYLLLADHGLTMPEQMHAHYMVAKYADWNTVLKMVERGGDITEVSNLLENWVTGNLRKKPQGDVTVYLERCEELIRMRLRFAKESARSPMKALQHCKWGSVLFNILHDPTEDYFSQVLDKVIEEQEWHILMHLVRLGMNRAERHWLFPQMVRQQQWGVCRMLLEKGVDVYLCLEALPQLMEKNQWTLVVRTMEYTLDDAVRRQVMQYAFHRRAGALFWHCLITMKDNESLGSEIRQKLFHHAISRDIWQAVKPLVEEKDAVGIQQRDVAFLKAIEEHLWDVVDHCQLLGADINMKDKNGETPLHREARKGEWKAVEEIVVREGQPNLLDKDGVSVLNRLIEDQQWDIVKLLIKYGGDIHLPALFNEHVGETHTPLQALITRRRVDVIQFTLRWCPDQRKGVNEVGETALHAACDSDRWDVMGDLVLRTVDPLAVTLRGQSALVYAVLNSTCPQRMVAECCRRGFSPHQPALTGPQDAMLDGVIGMVAGTLPEHDSRDYLRQSVITSPAACAVLFDLPPVVSMLYESQACSRAELLTLVTQLRKLTDLDTEKGRKLQQRMQEVAYLLQRCERSKCAAVYVQQCSKVTHVIEKCAPFLRQLVSTPRTLLSSCRLAIVRRFHFSDNKRLQRIDRLPLPVPLKNYLQFSDFCDPDYGSDLLG